MDEALPEALCASPHVLCVELKPARQPLTWSASVISHQLMDNLIHALFGVALSRAVSNRKVAKATWILIVAANLPDIDTVSGLWGSLTYLKYHRGITHSMVGVTALGLLLALGVYLWQRREWGSQSSSAVRPSLWAIGLICLLGTWSHLLIDFTHPYGIRAFFPFNDRVVAWEIDAMIDPLILGFLLCGLILPSLFRLISEEVGERGKTHGRGGAVVALILVAGLWGVRDVSHRSAIARLSSFSYDGEEPSGAFAVPRSANPFHWYGVVDTDRAYYTVDVDPDFSALRLNMAKAYFKPEDNDVLRTVRNSAAGKLFLNFARTPVYGIHRRSDSTVVTVRDLRLASTTRQNQGFVMTMTLAEDLRVLHQTFSFTGD
jgi:inner membrane protein